MLNWLKKISSPKNGKIYRNLDKGLKTLPPEKDPASIGNIIMELGFITKEEFKELLPEFKEYKKEQLNLLLGQFLISKINRFNSPQLELALLKQRQMKNGGVVEHSVLVKAMEIAKRTQASALTEVENFNTVICETTLKLKG